MKINNHEVEINQVWRLESGCLGLIIWGANEPATPCILWWNEIDQEFYSSRTWSKLKELTTLTAADFFGDSSGENWS